MVCGCQVILLNEDVMMIVYDVTLSHLSHVMNVEGIK